MEKVLTLTGSRINNGNTDQVKTKILVDRITHVEFCNNYLCLYLTNGFCFTLVKNTPEYSAVAEYIEKLEKGSK